MAKAKKQPKKLKDDLIEKDDDVVVSEDVEVDNDDVAPSDDVILSDAHEEGFEIGTIVADSPEAGEEEDDVDLSSAKDLDPAIFDENFDYGQDDGDDFLSGDDDDEDVDDYDEVY